MISKPEYLYHKARIVRLENMLFDFELKSDLYQIWTKWVKLPQEHKDRITFSWNEYYKKAHLGFYGQMFKKASEAMGNPEAVKAVVKEMHDKAVPYMAKPSSIDPEELRTKMERYFQTRAEVENEKAIVDEYAPVYESKKEVEGL